MISKDRPQNIIIIVTILITVLSGASLYSSASYYSGSYIVIQFMEIDLVNVTVTNYDNESLNPRLRMKFNVKAPESVYGEATLTYLRAQVYLNGESFRYTEFRYSIPLEYRTVTPNYNKNFTIAATISQGPDQQVIWNAASNDSWIFTIILTYFFQMFESPASSVDVAAFVWPE